MARPTTPTDTHPVYRGFPPCASSHFATGSANAASPTMPFRIAIDVMPICTVDRKRVGSWLSSSARAAPWSPSSASFCSRPLREATSAISDIANAPFTRIRKKRSAISIGAELSHSRPVFLLEPPADSRERRPIGGELHAVHLLVQRELSESVELGVLRHVPRDAGGEPKLLLAAVLGLRLVAAIAAFPHVVELQHEAHIVRQPIAAAAIHVDRLPRLEAGALGHRQHALHATDPRGVREWRRGAPVQPEQKVRRAGAGLQRALGGFAVVVHDVVLSGRKLHAESRAQRRLVLDRFPRREELVARHHAHVAQVVELPRLDFLLALVVVDVGVVSIDVRQDEGHAPTRRWRQSTFATQLRLMVSTSS